MERATSNWPKCSFFTKPISNTHPSDELTLLDVYNYIVGDKAKEATSKLRNLSDVEAARNFKANNFDYITPSGTFSKRSDKCLKEHSQIINIDFDHVKELEKLRQQLLADEYFDTQLLFVSPSGDGLKWFIEIDLSKASHVDYFRAIANYLKQTYNVEVDQSGKDISRACFLPHDPNCYINPKYL